MPGALRVPGPLASARPRPLLDVPMTASTPGTAGARREPLRMLLRGTTGGPTPSLMLGLARISLSSCASTTAGAFDIAYPRGTHVKGDWRAAAYRDDLVGDQLTQGLPDDRVNTRTSSREECAGSLSRQSQRGAPEAVPRSRQSACDPARLVDTSALVPIRRFVFSRVRELSRNIRRYACVGRLEFA